MNNKAFAFLHAPIVDPMKPIRSGNAPFPPIKMGGSSKPPRWGELCRAITFEATYQKCIPANIKLWFTREDYMCLLIAIKDEGIL